MATEFGINADSVAVGRFKVGLDPGDLLEDLERLAETP